MTLPNRRSRQEPIKYLKANYMKIINATKNVLIMNILIVSRIALRLIELESNKRNSNQSIVISQEQFSFYFSSLAHIIISSIKSGNPTSSSSHANYKRNSSANFMFLAPVTTLNVANATSALKEPIPWIINIEIIK